MVKAKDKKENGVGGTIDSLGNLISGGDEKRVKKSKSGGAQMNMFQMFHENIMAMNNSKFFAGLVIISLNVASKFVTIKLSKTTESYLKYTFSRQILIFAMAWMATRDIYSALVLTAVFVILADYLFNENSKFCCFSDDFKKKYLNMELNVGGGGGATSTPPVQNTGTRPMSSLNTPSEEDVKRSITILEQVKQQQQQKEQPNYNTPFSILK